MAMQGVTGFSKRQRQFFLDAFGHRCAFHTKEGTRWVRCNKTQKLEIHHIIPRGWCITNMRKSFHVNGAGQGIPLCKYHHNLVHPDVPDTLREYAKGNKNAFAEMMLKRKALNDKGIPYWCTDYDSMLARLNKRYVGKYLAKTKLKYPLNAKRGLNGRLKNKK